MLSGLYKPAVETGRFFRQEVNCTTQQGGEGKGGAGLRGAEGRVSTGVGAVWRNIIRLYVWSGQDRTGLTGHL